MEKKNNYKVVLETIKQFNNITFKELQGHVNIPESTTRRILNNLEKGGKIVKEFGAYQILSAPLVKEIPYLETANINIEQKKEIARKAFYCIKPGESIFLDGGTTIDFLADLLTVDLMINILTNSIPIFIKLYEKGFRDIVLVGGNYNIANHSLVGYSAVDFIEKYNFDIAFLEVSSVDQSFNCYTTRMDDLQIKRKVIERSKFVFVLADESKFDKKSFIKFATKNEVVIISE
ncbi:DeoR/GlpR family DNA-binding transcription regulator [Spiroplasma clarkii]|uniref:DeoR family transcriptional regulator, fructose operon transcriptional repressor n=1 Tax=Spiroplasma clarkii TaxID=2139 RepID=A0A2K8KKN5_9MOLU|nr:DeoR/GlpR family DNA-binding transcription regulator [Spiroplasma clarkii]ATX71029.1 DeoR family transcriptional regulator, fructose operon transcriptional repressor [Spiroplasma clarkii]